MRNTKCYILLFLVVIMCGLLFGLSYAKESGNINYQEPSNNTTKIKTTYSLGHEFTISNEDINEISIVNTSSSDLKYNIVLTALNNQENIYIELDDNEKIKYTDEIIYNGEIASFNHEGDYKHHRLKITAPDNTKFKINVEESQVSYLSTYIKKDKNVYQESNNYRYYGLNINNYLQYENETYRIIGLINNKIKIISEPSTLGVYNIEENYLTTDDYLKSFNNSSVTLTNSLDYENWLNTEESYFINNLLDKDNIYIYDKQLGITTSNNSNHYNRVIKEISNKSILINGDGSINHPYEVSYES